MTDSQCWKKCETVKNGQKLHQKCEFVTNFQKSLEEKDQNINLNDKFPLKIANLSLQKQNFPGIRFTNSAFSMHAYSQIGIFVLI